MKRKEIKLIILLFIIILAFISFEYDKDFDYLIKENLSFADEWQLKNVDYEYIDLSKEIKWKKITLSKEYEEYLFPCGVSEKEDEMQNLVEKVDGDDTWKLYKYENKIQVFADKEKEELYLYNDNYKKIVLEEFKLSHTYSWTSVYNSKGKKYIVYYPTKDKNIILYPNIIALTKLNLKKAEQNGEQEDITALRKASIIRNNKLFYGSTYLINLIGEYIFSLETIEDEPDDFEPPGICYYVFHRINLKTKEDYAANMFIYGIYTSYLGHTEYGSRLPIYDISLDKRYVYFWGGKMHKDIPKEDYMKFFPEWDGKKNEYGIFVYDLWEDKLYKIMDIEPRYGATIVNDINDNYLYLRICLALSGGEYKYEYYRTINFETYMKNKK